MVNEKNSGPAALFLQCERDDPYADYARMRAENPVFWDPEHGCWALYRYEDCKNILLHRGVRIPAIPTGGDHFLNEYVQLIRGKLVRLSNPPVHQAARQMAMRLFESMGPVCLPEILRDLLPPSPGDPEAAFANAGTTVDWVTSVCKKLPVASLLNAFDFSGEDSAFILAHMEQLVKIMGPVRTEEQAEILNGTAETIYQLAEKHILGSDLFPEAADPAISRDTLALCIGNLIGLFIQSYDAGRGLLANSLLQWLEHTGKAGTGRIGLQGNAAHDQEAHAWFHHCVQETLRLDPPVQHTRRVAGEDLFIGGRIIKKGELILVMLASANRDPEKFSDPDSFDPGRENKEEHLTYGAGIHQCPGRKFVSGLTASTLMYLFRNYKSIRIVDRKIQYEPLANVRLARKILLSLHMRHTRED